MRRNAKTKCFSWFGELEKKKKRKGVGNRRKGISKKDLPGENKWKRENDLKMLNLLKSISGKPKK